MGPRLDPPSTRGLGWTSTVADSERGWETAGCAPLAVDERRRAAGDGARGELGRVEEAVRPRSARPRRCTTRYSEESPIPKRARISDVGVLVSAYSRPISR